MNHHLIGSLLILLFSSCVAPKPPVPLPIISQSSLDTLKAELANDSATGSGVIEGQLFAVTRGGDVKIGAGREVLLSRQSAELGNYLVGNRDSFKSLLMKANADLNPIQLEYKLLLLEKQNQVMRTTANAQGDFRFVGLPAGHYSLEATMSWEYVHVGTSYAVTRDTGGNASAFVSLKNGETVTVNLTP